MISNASSENTKFGTYICPSNGVFVYSCQSANATGSTVEVKLNGARIDYANGPINSICGAIHVEKNDEIYLYAYGYKDWTSNASAYIQGMFAPY